ncbi:MAG: hypothetical protein PUB42_05700 [Firmicutes bacterium]|nr:hypothetical protein [Bacillota bacterium]
MSSKYYERILGSFIDKKKRQNQLMTPVDEDGEYRIYRRMSHGSHVESIILKAME